MRRGKNTHEHVWIWGSATWMGNKSLSIRVPSFEEKGKVAKNTQRFLLLFYVSIQEVIVLTCL